MTFSEWYKRLRHSYGYGIHSPSAYRMIVEVLCPPGKYKFYAYNEIDKMTASKHRKKFLKMLFRLLVELRPAQVYVAGDKLIKDTVELAGATLSPAPDADFLIIAEATTEPLKVWSRNTLFCESGIVHARPLLNAPGDLQVFDGVDNILAISRNGCPGQVFKLFF